MTAKTTLQNFVNQNNYISTLIIAVDHSIWSRSHRGAIGRAAERAGKGQGEVQGVGRDAFAGGHSGMGLWQEVLPLPAFLLVTLPSHAHHSNPQSKPSSALPPQRYVDGGFTGLQPVSSLEEPVITVSPFTGELDICPRDCPAIFFCFQIFNGSIQISIENLCRISYALFPPSTMVSHQLFFPASFWLKQIDAGPAFPSFKVQLNLHQ